jgi:hypothetical protein
MISGIYRNERMPGGSAGQREGEKQHQDTFFLSGRVAVGCGSPLPLIKSFVTRKAWNLSSEYRHIGRSNHRSGHGAKGWAVFQGSEEGA